MYDGPQVSSAVCRVAIIGRGWVLSDQLDRHLVAAGYEVLRICGERTSTSIGRCKPDIVILEWVELELEVLRQLRRAVETKSVPVIVVAEHAGETDIVATLGAGADNILSTPFSVPEFLARVDALLRRRTPCKNSSVLTVGDTEFDKEAVRIRRRGKTVELGPTDRQLLQLFMTHPGEVLRRQDILLAVWGQQGAIDARTIDVHVGRLRKALLTAWRSDPITTVRGTGYRFDPK